jgi:hypothetical protein
MNMFIILMTIIYYKPKIYSLVGYFSIRFG